MSKILIVDDEPELVFLTKKVLEQEGQKVLVAKDSSECLKVLEDETPDLILLDVMMPNENGWDLCKKIKGDKKTKDIPVVMFTVRTSDESTKTSLDCADGQIDKPFKIEKLLGLVNTFLKDKSSD